MDEETILRECDRRVHCLVTEVIDTTNVLIKLTNRRLVIVDEASFILLDDTLDVVSGARLFELNTSFFDVLDDLIFHVRLRTLLDQRRDLCLLTRDSLYLVG